MELTLIQVTRPTDVHQLFTVGFADIALMECPERGFVVWAKDPKIPDTLRGYPNHYEIVVSRAKGYYEVRVVNAKTVEQAIYKIKLTLHCQIVDKSN